MTHDFSRSIKAHPLNGGVVKIENSANNDIADNASNRDEFRDTTGWEQSVFITIDNHSNDIIKLFLINYQGIFITWSKSLE